MLGTTRVMSDATGAAVSQFEYTAFGVPYPLEGGGDQRHGYAGAWGYQSDAAPGPAPSVGAMPFLHVGARYYDPTTGRFLQRDPIGITGGLSVYNYLGASPTVSVDPSGLWPIEDPPGFAEWRFNNPSPKPPRTPKPKPPVRPRRPNPVPPVFRPIVWLKDKLTLLGPGMMGACVGDLVMTAAGMPFWTDTDGDGPRGEWFWCTRTVGRMIIGKEH